MPILAENKRKLKMNIDNTIKKNTKIRENRVFEFGDKSKKNLKSIKNNESLEINNNISKSQQFTSNEFGSEFTGEEYPSLDLVGANTEYNINNKIDPMQQNEMNNNGGNFNNQIGNDFVFLEKDFNFDK